MRFHLIVLASLLALTACGGGADCDAGTPILGKPKLECADPPAAAASK